MTLLVEIKIRIRIDLHRLAWPRCSFKGGPCTRSCSDRLGSFSLTPATCCAVTLQPGVTRRGQSFASSGDNVGRRCLLAVVRYFVKRATHTLTSDRCIIYYKLYILFLVLYIAFVRALPHSTVPARRHLSAQHFVPDVALDAPNSTSIRIYYKCILEIYAYITMY